MESIHITKLFQERMTKFFHYVFEEFEKDYEEMATPKAIKYGIQVLIEKEVFTPKQLQDYLIDYDIILPVYMIEQIVKGAELCIW